MKDKIKILLIGSVIFFIGNVIGYIQGISVEPTPNLTEKTVPVIIMPNCSDMFLDPYVDSDKKKEIPPL